MKGIILGQKNYGVYVMDTNGCFHFVEGFTEYSEGTEIEFAISPSRSFSRPVWTWMGAAACFLLVGTLSVFGVNYFRNPESAQVAADADKSVELGENSVPLAEAPGIVLNDVEDPLGAALTEDVKQQDLDGPGVPTPGVPVTGAAASGAGTAGVWFALSSLLLGIISFLSRKKSPRIQQRKGKK